MTSTPPDEKLGRENLETTTSGAICGVTTGDQRSELAELTWRPIETAPKEGRFLVYMSNGSIEVAKPLKNSKTMVIGGAFSFDRTEKPTHWMPLPAPPATTPAERSPVVTDPSNEEAAVP